MNKDGLLNRIILCVDDDPDDLQILREALSTVDGRHTIVEANDGADGLVRLKEMVQKGTPPCLVVLDINMPKMDGKQTFVTIKSDEVLSAIPVVILSTSSSPLDKLFFAKKDTEFITKPIEFNHMVQVASKLLSYCSH